MLLNLNLELYHFFGCKGGEESINTCKFCNLFMMTLFYIDFM